MIQQQRQPLGFGAQAHHVDHIAHHAAQIENLAQQMQPPRFDLGHFQHIIDQGQKMAAAAVDDIQFLALSGPQIGIAAQQRRKPQDGVQGGAQFVAHIGQENTFRLAGGLGGIAGQPQFPGALAHLFLQILLGAAQGLFRLPHGGDIAGDSQHPQRAAIGIGDRRFDGFQQHPAAIAGIGYPFLVDAGSTGGQGQPVVLAEGIGQGGLDEIIIGAADDFGLRAAEKQLELAIAQHEHPVQILQPHQSRHGFQHRAQAAALLVEIGHPAAHLVAQHPNPRAQNDGKDQNRQQAVPHKLRIEQRPGGGAEPFIVQGLPVGGAEGGKPLLHLGQIGGIALFHGTVELPGIKGEGLVEIGEHPRLVEQVIGGRPIEAEDLDRSGGGGPHQGGIAFIPANH
ncbi:hypothetical protein GALL_289750 [mine drainage metagenome]|uniref:Uncharacterized protein n=1 Tax=mine drainage metagenome TaxID=410659 RepID=A0A1J5R100_9ZZZZ